jgi:hypothetical protein
VIVVSRPGTYTQVAWGKQSVLMAVAYADATDGRYLQTYLNPALTAGPLAFDATIEWYEPLEVFHRTTGEATEVRTGVVAAF